MVDEPDTVIFGIVDSVVDEPDTVIFGGVDSIVDTSDTVVFDSTISGIINLVVLGSGIKRISGISGISGIYGAGIYLVVCGISKYGFGTDLGNDRLVVFHRQGVNDLN